MSETKPIYSGEAVLLNWHDAKSGRKIVLQLEKYAPGAHPFDGLDGERFGVVIVGPLAPAEHAEPVARKGKAGGTIGSDAGGQVVADLREEAPRTNSKRRWQDMPASQRAALMVKDVEFQRYVSERWRSDVDESAADYNLKKFCKVNSKADLSTDEYSADRLDKLQSDFRAWQQARGHGVI